jgi:predicted RNase H-like HicB family nuclease
MSSLVVEQDEDGVYIVWCPVLPGCHTFGRTPEEALKNIRETIEAHLGARKAMGDPVPQSR